MSIFKDEKELEQKGYKKILQVKYRPNTYQETNFINNLVKYDDSFYGKHLEYEGNLIPYVRILEDPIYTDIIVHESFDNLKYKHFYYSFDPKKDKYISFRDKKIKIQPNITTLDKKIFYIESYMESINSSKISIYLDNKLKKNKIGEMFIDYDNQNITIYDFTNNEFYRYTKNTSYESSFYLNKDLSNHNDIIDIKYNLDEFGVIKNGDHYKKSTRFGFVESIYKYNTPISVYENKYEDMYMVIAVAYDMVYKDITYVLKTIYGK